jgi:formylglycine-generating enzyme required for sulfatase activity
LTARAALGMVAGLAAVGVLASTGPASLARTEYRRLARARRQAGGQTELRVLNPARAALSLRRAGATLEAAETVHLATGEQWLLPGRYYVEAAVRERRQFFPVTVGPDLALAEGDGSWTITVRRPALEEPPRLHPGVPPYVFIPGGPFALGERQNPGQAHVVWVHSFHIASFEATNGEFRRFLDDPRGHADRANWTVAGWAWKEGEHSQATARLPPTDRRYPRFGRDELPVMLVTWHEARAFCRWLTRTLGEGRWLYRLPTEAEWEKAARGPDGFDYGLGMELSEPQASLYNWRKNPGAATTLVGVEETLRSYRPNRYGLYHASGNAREWTQSVFARYSAEHPYHDDERNADDAAGMRVTRGGSWYSASAVRLQLAYREEFQPELSSDDLGFRVAVVLGAGAGTRSAAR